VTHVAAKTNSTDAASPEFQSLLAKAIYETSPEGILVVDAAGMVVSHNSQYVDVWQLQQAQLQGRQPSSAIGTDDAPLLAAVLEKVKDPSSFLARVRELYDNPQLNDHCEIELKDGRTLERHSTVLHNKDGTYLGRVWFFRDITRQKQTETALTEQARHDPLTGTANRRYFFERAQQEFARAQRYQTPLSIACIDVDHFKQTNDRFGHAAGDEVLKSLCSYGQSLLRESELFARIGGEEFAILMPNTSLGGATHLAERLRRVTANSKLNFNNQEIELQISIGVTRLKASDASIEDCLRRADGALYHAKQNGRNRVEAAA
jgi:diguanylate cyclase (GGDEF)-like protein/PAS domain S-box-containing protein